MAVNFDGSTEYYLRSVATTANDNFTLSCWLNIDALPTTGSGSTVFDMVMYNGADGGTGPYNGWGFGIGGDNGTTGSKLIGLYGGVAWKNTSYTFSSAGVWYHVVMRRSSGTLTFWVDGADVGYSNTGAPQAGGPTDSYTIGCQDRNSEGNIWFFDGKVAEAACWNRALSDAEIISLAKGYAPSFFQRNLQSYIPLINATAVRDYKAASSITTGGSPDDFAHQRIIYPSD